MREPTKGKVPQSGKKSQGRAFRGSWMFLAGVTALYILTMSINPEIAIKALSSFTVLLSKILPVLGVVLVLLFLFNLFMNPKWIRHYVGENTGLKGWLVALSAGMLSAGPIYPWYVLLGDLKQKGMRRSLIAAFLYARAIKFPLIPLILQAFGFAFTATLFIYILLFAIINGLLIEMFIGKDDPLDGTS